MAAQAAAAAAQAATAGQALAGDQAAALQHEVNSLQAAAAAARAQAEAGGRQLAQAQAQVGAAGVVPCYAVYRLPAGVRCIRLLCITTGGLAALAAAQMSPQCYPPGPALPNLPALPLPIRPSTVPCPA